MAAPFYFLLQQGVCLEGFGSGSGTSELRLFANNYAAQGVKIKGCKAALNRAYHYLSQLSPDELRACPFLSERDGIYAVDLSFIPEKYRLDVIRAEKILNTGLKTWLTTVESSLQKTGTE
jgi:ATP-dependent Lon protease